MLARRAHAQGALVQGISVVAKLRPEALQSTVICMHCAPAMLRDLRGLEVCNGLSVWLVGAAGVPDVS